MSSPNYSPNNNHLFDHQGIIVREWMEKQRLMNDLFKRNFQTLENDISDLKQRIAKLERERSSE